MRVRWLGAIHFMLAARLILLATATSDATGCPTVCSRTDTYAIGANFQPCACAAPGCTCVGECRGAFQSHIMLYAKNASGVCDSFATDCSVASCSSTSSTGSTNPSSSPTPSSSSSNAPTNATNNNGNPRTSTTGSNNKASNAGRSTSNGGTGSTAMPNASKGLQTWQIILIIASSVAVFLVIATALLSAYCKVRRDLARSEVTEGGFYYGDDNAMAVQEQVRPSGWRSSPDSIGESPEKAALGESSSTVNGTSRYSQSYDGARFSDQMRPPSSQPRPTYSPSFDKAVAETRPRHNSIEL